MRAKLIWALKNLGTAVYSSGAHHKNAALMIAMDNAMQTLMEARAVPEVDDEEEGCDGECDARSCEACLDRAISAAEAMSDAYKDGTYE
jgi:hypothetical protein